MYEEIDSVTTKNIEELRDFKKACGKIDKPTVIRLILNEDNSYTITCFRKDMI